jgi:type II secretion system protein N
MRLAQRFRRITTKRPRPTEAAAMTRKPWGLYIATGVSLFLLGLLCSFYLAFPDAILRQRLVYELETRLPIQVDLAEATLQPLLTLAGKQMTVRLSGQPEALFQLDTFHISPCWSSLLTGDPGLEGQINSSTGELSFSWQQSGPLAITGTTLPFDIPLATIPATRFSGNLSTGEVTTTAPLQSETRSRININLNQVVVKGLEALTGNKAGLRLGELSLKVNGQGTSFSIEQFEISGGDLVVSGTGTLMLAIANPQNSRINLNLSVRAGNQADPTLAGLLELVGTPQANGSRKLRMTGTLARPVIK